MKIAFWAAAVYIFYAYIGYFLYLLVRRRFHSRPVLPSPIRPRVSIIIAAYNEAANLPQKLSNLAKLDYPADLIEIVVASDGSTDETARVLDSSSDARVRPLILTEHRGKPNALNQAVLAATGEILVFLDARQMIEHDAITKLIENFADPKVGCVSGELVIAAKHDANAAAHGVGLYWRFEKLIRKLESDTGSAVQATGAIYAIRKQLYTPIPDGTLLDDVYVPMHAARAGYRVLFESAAVAWDQPEQNPGLEFRRKSRTLTGNYQLLRLCPWLLTAENPLRFEFISHKLLRLWVPFALLVTLISAALAGGIYRWALAAQFLFYAAAALGPFIPTRVCTFATSFVVLNAAAGMAFFNAIFGRTNVWHNPRAIHAASPLTTAIHTRGPR